MKQKSNNRRRIMAGAGILFLLVWINGCFNTVLDEKFYKDDHDIRGIYCLGLVPSNKIYLRYIDFEKREMESTSKGLGGVLGTDGGVGFFGNMILYSVQTLTIND